MDQHPQPEDFAFLDQTDFREVYVSAEGPGQMRFYIENASCAKCLNRIETAVGELPGVRHARLDLGAKVLEVSIGDDGSFAQVARKVTGLGYLVQPLKAEQRADEMELRARRREMLRMGVAGACAGNIMLLSISQYAGADKSDFDQYFGFISLLLFLPVLFYIAIPFYKNTWASLRARKFSIDLPIVAAVLVAFVFSVANLLRGRGDTYFDAVSALMFLLLASRFWLAHLQRTYVRSLNLYSLLNIRRARRFNPASGAYDEVPLERLKTGDRILVRSGEKLPADGELLSSRVHINSSVLTGESYPVEVRAGQSVYAGTTLAHESAEFTATAVGDQTRMGQLMATMAKEANSRTPLITFTDRIGQLFTLGVLCLGALFTLYYWHIDPVAAIERSLALTLLACPCALALATPMAHSLALLRAARRGSFIKRAEAVERLPQTRKAFFDKTGTLTSGQLTLLVCDPPAPSAELLSIIVGLELKSHHPVARCLVQTWPDTHPAQLTDWREIVGVGVSGRIGQDLYELKAATGDTPSAEQGRLVNSVALYRNGTPCLRLDLGDNVRRESFEVIKQLQNRGIETYLITGDRAANARRVAEAVGIEAGNIFAEVSPEEKHRLLKANPHAMMVGDGVNDAVAMAAAHLSVAVQGSMEASLKAADIFISRGGLEPVGELLLLGEETMKVIKRNLWFSLAYNLTGGALALTGHIHPLLAAILMPASSVTLLISVLWGTKRLREMGRSSSNPSEAPLAPSVQQAVRS